jgi:hypothetical protein
MTITKIETHIDDALKRLLYQFQDKSKIVALQTMQAQQIQELENASYDYIASITLASATGATLDRWGFVLGEDRLGANDADYRVRLYFAITRNLSNGTPEELINFTAFLFTASMVQLEEIFPAVISLTAINAQGTADPALIKTQLQQLCPAGVRLHLLSVGTSVNPFAFLGHSYLDAKGFDEGEFVSGY